MSQLTEVPFSIIKKVIFIRDSDYPYKIDEDGNGICVVDGLTVNFHLNEYSEILIETISLSKQNLVLKSS